MPQPAPDRANGGESLDDILARFDRYHPARIDLSLDRTFRLLHPDPEVKREYVVLVEVQVDAGRVMDRLTQVGVIRPVEPPPEELSAGTLRLELEGLESWWAYETVREALLERAGARAVRPIGFERGLAVLEVEISRKPRQVFQGLRGALPPELEVLPVSAGKRHLVLRLTERREPPAATPAAEAAALER